jgi:hypothetical protein
LDCCHSGAFAEHTKAGAAAPAVTAETFSASDAGLYVLTAADALQFAWDGAELRSGDQAAAGFSRFTSWLVEGLEKGEAAPDDEQITMDALYRYVYRRARLEGSLATPQRFVQGGVGELVISANPLSGLSQINPGITSALASMDHRMRLGAVAELALHIEEGQPSFSHAARLLLQRHLRIERDYQVRRAITKAVPERPRQAARHTRDVQQIVPHQGTVGQKRRRTNKETQQAEEEKRRAEAAQKAGEENRPLRPELVELTHGFLARVVIPVADDGAEPVSDALLVARTDLATGLKGAVVLGPDIAKMLEKAPRRLPCLGFPL